MKRMYAVEPVNVRAEPSARAKKIGSLAQGKEVEALGRDGDWVRVQYSTPWRTVTGWAHGDYLAPVSANRVPHVPGVVAIPDAMRSDDLRAQQFIRVGGVVRRNLCGPFCAAALAGLSIDIFLGTWRNTDPDMYHVSVVQDQPVGIEVVKTMLAAAGVRWGDQVPLTVPALTDALAFGAVLCGVQIDRAGRMIRRGGVGHWVVLTAIEAVETTAWLTFYNPFCNGFEYAWLGDLQKSASGFNNGGAPVTLFTAAKIQGAQTSTPPPAPSVDMSGIQSAAQVIITQAETILQTIQAQ